MRNELLVDPDMKSRRAAVRWVDTTAIAIVVALSASACASATAGRRPLMEPTRARAFVDTFDRILVAGFLADHMSDRGRDLDVNNGPAGSHDVAITRVVRCDRGTAT